MFSLQPFTRYFPPVRHIILLFIGIIIPVLLAGEIAEEILEQERFAFEQPLMLWIHQHFGEPLQIPSLFFHYIGKTFNAVLITLIIATLLWYNKHKNKAIFLILSTSLSAIIMFIAKQFFNRPRPTLWPRIVMETGASFPSGHSTYAAALATLAILLCWPNRWRYVILIAGLIFTFSMGVSRMILGVHYPTDVFVGWVTGASTVIGLYILMYPYLNPTHTPH